MPHQEYCSLCTISLRMISKVDSTRFRLFHRRCDLVLTNAIFLKVETMKTFSLFFLALVAGTNAIELTPDNWDTETAGKTVLIKFLAPW
jgi:hypothetical protein